MTIYRLARHAADYRKCRALIAQRNGTNALRFPTIMAEREGKLVGLLGTEGAYTKALVAGPLVISKDIVNPAFLTVKLIDLYDDVMRRAGVTVYLFCTKNARLVNWLALGGLEPWRRTEDGMIWFERKAG